MENGGVDGKRTEGREPSKIGAEEQEVGRKRSGESGRRSSFDVRPGSID
jgi:hypothetical protein